ncbi:MAG: hypothetical protein RLY77_10 [Pseudomonadota bacterium]|jgi:uncharacterized membrane protein YidH (DUF202 family)
MSDMTAAEKTELALIPLVGVIVWRCAEHLPARIGIGFLLLAVSVLLLFQGLIRDVWLLFKQRQQSRNGVRQTALCMCVESTVGVTGVVAGLILAGAAADAKIFVSQLLWSILAVAVLAGGFAIKDFVFAWHPFRLRRDKDHVNLVFSWRK